MAQASVGLSILLGLSSQLCFASKILHKLKIGNPDYLKARHISEHFSPMNSWKESGVQEIPTDTPHISVHESGGERGSAEQGGRLLLSLNLQPGELGQEIRLFFVKPGYRGYTTSTTTWIGYTIKGQHAMLLFITSFIGHKDKKFGQKT